MSNAVDLPSIWHLRVAATSEMNSPSIDYLRHELQQLGSKLVAIEAQWDCDWHCGWRLEILAVTRRWQCHSAEPLDWFKEGDSSCSHADGDWPEAKKAAAMGEQLGAEFGVPFFFPSPDRPEFGCPHWWERKKAYPCRNCGVLLFQDKRCSYHGVCSTCNFNEAREKREAQWTPEERAGPKCATCGDPAERTLDDTHLCLGCFEKYTTYDCSQCGARTRLLKTEEHSDLCLKCEVRSRLVELPEAKRQAVRDLNAASMQLFATKDLLDWEDLGPSSELVAAHYAIRELCKRDD